MNTARTLQYIFLVNHNNHWKCYGVLSGGRRFFSFELCNANWNFFTFYLITQWIGRSTVTLIRTQHHNFECTICARCTVRGNDFYQINMRVCTDGFTSLNTCRKLLIVWSANYCLKTIKLGFCSKKKIQWRILNSKWNFDGIFSVSDLSILDLFLGTS